MDGESQWDESWDVAGEPNCKNAKNPAFFPRTCVGFCWMGDLNERQPVASPAFNLSEKGS